MNILHHLYGEKWTMKNMWRRATCRKPIMKRKKPRVGYFPLPTGKIVPFEEYVREMGETPDLLEARPPGWDENKEERRVNKRTRIKLFRSIVLAAIAFFLFSYGYNQISLMQNYLHESQYFMQIKYMPDYENTYGHVQLLAKYCLAASTAMFVPYLIRIFQDKWILFVSAGAYGTFVSLGFLDAKYTIMPSGFIAGLACMPFFTTFNMYMVHISQRLGDLNQKRPYNGVQSNWLLYKFNSMVFFAWFFGYALSSMTCTILFYNVLSRNNTYIHENNMTCGRTQCDKAWPNWWDSMMEEVEIPQIDKYAYANIVNASFIIIAMAFFLFGCMEGQTAKIWSHLKDDKGFELNFKLGWRAVFSWNRFLLAPIFIFMGWSTDFIAYTYPKAFPICSLNSWISFAGLSAFGLMASVVAAISPWLALKKTGWKPIMIVGVTTYLLCIIFLAAWKPVASIGGYKFTNVHPQLWETIMFITIPAIWGIGTGALYSAANVKIEFEYTDPDDMVQMFSVYHHWQAVGVVIGYATRNVATCTGPKLYGLLGALVLGVVMYLLYERQRLRDPNAIKIEDIPVIRFLPNPHPEQMANESDVEEEGTSTSEEDEDDEEGRAKKKVIKYKRQPPPNDPRMGKAWRTPYFPPDLEIPRKYITPDGNIMIMPKHQKPPFTVQDSFDSNVLRNTDLDQATVAARKVCFHLGYGGEPLFYEVNALVEDERELFPCKFDSKGNIIEGHEDEPDFYPEDSARNARHNIPERFEVVLQRLWDHQTLEREAAETRKAEELRRRDNVAFRRHSTDDQQSNLLEFD